MLKKCVPKIYRISYFLVLWNIILNINKKNNLLDQFNWSVFRKPSYIANWEKNCLKKFRLLFHICARISGSSRDRWCRLTRHPDWCSTFWMMGWSETPKHGKSQRRSENENLVLTPRPTFESTWATTTCSKGSSINDVHNFDNFWDIPCKLCSLFSLLSSQIFRYICVHR